MRREAVPLRALLLALVLAGCTSAPPASNPNPDAMAMVAAEQVFAADAVRNGVKAAFLRALDERGTLFRPGPVEGRDFVATHPDPPIVLDWRPQWVDVASSGELGFSTGPWKATARSGQGDPSYGQFFTVWNKNADGTWRVLVDHGIEHKDAVGWASPLVVQPRDGSQSIENLLEAETRFAAMSANIGVAAAYKDFGTPATRALREGSSPTEPVRETGLWQWTVTDSGTARSKDFGWVRGRYRASASDNGYYVRVWSVERGTWKVLADVLAPIKSQ